VVASSTPVGSALEPSRAGSGCESEAEDAEETPSCVGSSSGSLFRGGASAVCGDAALTTGVGAGGEAGIETDGVGEVSVAAEAGVGAAGVGAAEEAVVGTSTA
jgi:hypothetical protein